MKKKVLSLLLASAMVASLAACGGGDGGASTTPAGDNTGGSSAAAGTESTGGDTESTYQLSELHLVVDGTITATVDNGQAALIEQLNAALSERAGYDVTVTIDQYDHSGYTDAVGRLMVSGDLPDAMIMPASMFKQYSTTGILWDMADAYDNAEFQSRITLPAVNERLKDAQGHLYGFTPAYGNGCVTYVKKAWLDAVGVDINTVTDYASYIDMLTKFAQGDPDGDGKNGNTYGVIAAGFANMGEAPYINYMPEFWQGAYPAILQDENGVWYDGVQTDATKEALLRLKEAYENKLIDPDTENAGTKDAREKWFSNNQTGSSGVFTYWAGTWYQTLTDNLVKNEVDPELVQLPPIKEIVDTWGGYLNREAPVWVIFDDGDGDDARENEVFDLLCDAMLDGDKVQTLWTYGAEDVHWSTKAESFTTNPGTDNAKDYDYPEGTFHLKQSPNDPNSVWKKNYIDNALVIAPLTNGFSDASELALTGNAFFNEHCVDAPLSPSSETLTAETGNITDAVKKMIVDVVKGEVDVDTAMETYKSTVGATVDTILAELNAPAE